ncbi:Isopenicillin N synthase and related dioxygenases (PcbC) (PDB:1BK0) [Commensalibacter communis]|uniref:2-oxoglutarate-dependent ethylene/succinate-forming enzyme n=1 Tax=Commensalibacter communis TaxID=2972786 RepID=A0A9W4TPS5_9PROT|nr:2-oxoglutarate and iron-dependent oxygenase domain-containing protein [Commensalibacter communis]CAI3954556.1 Isopenicillin N synthase and related dioxygenases (PcbC) (PDB:1BK0) [Commensalibacter communis]CAI3955586.1 Isopenicillin N synthase and related dioxygenases (PcbC) (PDB:1BK0) [Commensalibacter communis]CAI3955945.1 Isopenicillin N synthase and related dioxygenases (PcbC) (PDB:1BK0) [Commensalibacter communis]CAI3957714.1 Isopenicillin N synthase and related dioxygenases (PcbC) (PDB:
MQEYIPVIDISDIYQSDKNRHLQIAQRVDEACRHSGFFCITGHHISQKDIQRIKAFARHFFSLPMEDKQSVSILNNQIYRGYSSHEMEQLDYQRSIDYKEIFDMGYHLDADHPEVQRKEPFRGSNQHPEHLIAGWTKLFETHYQNMTELAKVLFRIIALGLKLEENFFNDMFFESLSTFRIIHYPGLPEQRNRVVCGAHTDYGILTILHQDDVGGLQVRSKDNQWVDVPPITDGFVVNIGDMMAMWTNDRYKSTSHRVLNIGQDRISMPFFTEPHPSQLIQCLPQCSDEQNPPKYPPVICRDWLLKRFKAAYNG